VRGWIFEKLKIPSAICYDLGIWIVCAMCMTNQGVTVRKWRVLRSARQTTNTASCTMPKRALGRFNNLGGYAERNTKKAGLSAQKKRRNICRQASWTHFFCFYLTFFQPNGNLFSNPSFSPPLHGLLSTSACDHYTTRLMGSQQGRRFAWATAPSKTPQSLCFPEGHPCAGVPSTATFDK
jgi:hypothetical protein